jgi:probable addiction module antidote protein
MAIHRTRFDAADYLETEDDMAAYLAECAEGDDPRLVAHALGTIARARNLSQLARDTGMMRAGLSRAVAYDGNPSFATVSKVAKALGLKISVMPTKAAARKPAERCRRTRRAAALQGAKRASARTKSCHSSHA